MIGKSEEVEDSEVWRVASPLIDKSKLFALQIIKVCNLEQCIELKKLLVSSINTAKSNSNLTKNT